MKSLGLLLPHDARITTTLQHHLHPLLGLRVELHGPVAGVRAVLDRRRHVHGLLRFAAIAQAARGAETGRQDRAHEPPLRPVVQVAPIIEAPAELLISAHPQGKTSPPAWAIVWHAPARLRVRRAAFPTSVAWPIGRVPPWVQLPGVDLQLPAHGGQALQVLGHQALRALVAIRQQLGQALEANLREVVQHTGQVPARLLNRIELRGHMAPAAAAPSRNS
mmetsp:Transcript_30433/g.86802  ORF Transcript_30433/g.86802 Transcript_30433/m.86802 type:complete len:220 (+) Transcript_30433:1382-2041(+)